MCCNDFLLDVITLRVNSYLEGIRFLIFSIGSWYYYTATTNIFSRYTVYIFYFHIDITPTSAVLRLLLLYVRKNISLRQKNTGAIWSQFVGKKMYHKSRIELIALNFSLSLILHKNSGAVGVVMFLRRKYIIILRNV